MPKKQKRQFAKLANQDDQKEVKIFVKSNEEFIKIFFIVKIKSIFTCPALNNLL